MALTSVEMRDINKAMPVNNEYSVGNRLEFVTTEGAMSSVTITEPTMSAVTINSMVMQSPTSTIDPEAITEAFQIQGGFNSYRASGGSAVRVSTSIPVGGKVVITNLSVTASGLIVFSTVGTLGVAGAGSTYGTTAQASGCFAILPGLQTCEMTRVSSGMWISHYGTGVFSTFSTSVNAS